MRRVLEAVKNCPSFEHITKSEQQFKGWLRRYAQSVVSNKKTIDLTDDSAQPPAQVLILDDLDLSVLAFPDVAVHGQGGWPEGL